MPGVVVASPMLIPRVHPEMCSSFTIITCPTCGCCNHLPFENTRPAALPLAPSAQAILHDLTQRSLIAAGHPGADSQTPFMGLTPSPSGVSDQPGAYRKPTAARWQILPLIHSWHPPTSLHHHGNHHAPDPNSPCRAWKSASSQACLLIICPPTPHPPIYSQHGS